MYDLQITGILETDTLSSQCTEPDDLRGTPAKDSIHSGVSNAATAEEFGLCSCSVLLSLQVVHLTEMCPKHWLELGSEAVSEEPGHCPFLLLPSAFLSSFTCEGSIFSKSL